MAIIGGERHSKQQTHQALSGNTWLANRWLRESSHDDPTLAHEHWEYRPVRVMIPALIL